MNILYLLHTLKTDKLSELTAVIDAPPLDMNLAIWEALGRGDIEIDEEKDLVVPLKDAEPWSDPDLTNKIVRVIQHYAKNKTNITVGRLSSYIKDPVSDNGYPRHEYIMSLQSLVDSGVIVEDIIEVPKNKKRPYHKFVFLCLPENEEHNHEWNSESVNKWIATLEGNKVK